MKAFFNVARNIFAVIGLVLSIALAIVLCSGEYKAIWSRSAPGQPAALLLEDFDYFFQAFEQTHPDPYSAFGGERNFHKEVKKLRRSLGRGWTGRRPSAGGNRPFSCASA